MPYPGTMTTSREFLRMSPASSYDAVRMDPISPCSPVASSICPKAPNSTLLNERFMARHMTMARMRPDMPSSAPATISRLFESTKPSSAAEIPAYALSSAMTVGISAPPMGMMRNTPKTKPHTMMIGMAHVRPGLMTRATIKPMATPSTPKLTKICPGYTNGRCGRISCSFPAAMSEPVNTRHPSTISIPSTAITKPLISGV